MLASGTSSLAVLAVVIATASAGVAGASAYFAWHQIQQARIANALPTAIDLFGDFRWTTRERHRIPELLAEVEDDVPLTRLPDEIITTAHLLDNVGLLVAEGLVPVEIVAGYMGGSVLDTWRKLQPHIEAERVLRKIEAKIRVIKRTSSTLLSPFGMRIQIGCARS